MSHPAPNRPAWRPDPSGRHAYRYFDGERWTEHVSDGQRQGVEPLARPAHGFDVFDAAMMPLLTPRQNRRALFRAMAASPHSGAGIRHMAFAFLLLVGAAFVGVGLFGASWYVRSRAAAMGREATIERLKIESISADAPDAVPVGRLVHVKGVARARAPVTDDRTGVSMSALVMARRTSMYQWIETCTQHDQRPKAVGRDEYVEDELRRPTLRRVARGTLVRWTKCSYTQDWKDMESTIRPDRAARYANPPFLHERGTHRFVPAYWTLGKLELPFGDLPELPSDQLPSIPLAPEHLAGLHPDLRGRIRVEGNALYTGDPKAPKVGDVRFLYIGVKQLTLTLIGERTERGLKPHRLPDGSEFFQVREGTFSIEQLAGSRRQAASGPWWAHAWFGAIVAFGVALMFWPIRGWGRAVPGPSLVTGAGVLVFVPLMTAAVYATMLARTWWASDRETAVLAAVVAGGAGALLLTASAARLLLRARKNCDVTQVTAGGLRLR